MTISFNPLHTALQPQIRAAAREPLPTAPTAPPTPPEDFDRTLRQAVLMSMSGSDATAATSALFWKALKAGTTVEHSLRVIDATWELGYSFKDLRIAALNQSMMRINTRPEAMRVAEALEARGQVADDWTKGALRKALVKSTDALECLEVAAFARDRGPVRFRDIRADALEKARKL